MLLNSRYCSQQADSLEKRLLTKIPLSQVIVKDFVLERFRLAAKSRAATGWQGRKFMFNRDQVLIVR